MEAVVVRAPRPLVRERAVSLPAVERRPTEASSWPREAPWIDWRGAQVKHLIGLDERSATGLGADIGALLVTVPDASEAQTDGFRVLNVILELDGVAMGSLDDLDALYSATSAGQTLAFGVHRSQQDVVIVVTR